MNNCFVYKTIILYLKSQVFKSTMNHIATEISPIYLKDDIIQFKSINGVLDEYPIMDLRIAYELQSIVNPSITAAIYYDHKLSRWFIHTYVNVQPYIEFNFYNKYNEQNRGPHPYPKGSIVELNIPRQKTTKKFKIINTEVIYEYHESNNKYIVYRNIGTGKYMTNNPKYNNTNWTISLIKSSHHILQKDDKLLINNKEYVITKIIMDYFIKLQNGTILTIRQFSNGTYYFDSNPQEIDKYSIIIKKKPYNLKKGEKRDTFFHEGDDVYVRIIGHPDERYSIFNRRPRYIYTDQGVEYEVYRLQSDTRWVTTQNKLAFVEFVINPKLSRKLDNPDLANTIPSLNELNNIMSKKFQIAGIPERNVISNTLEQKEDYDQNKLLNVLETSKFVLIPTQKEKNEINKLSAISSTTVTTQNVGILSEDGTRIINVATTDENVLRETNDEYQALINRIIDPTVNIGNRLPNWVKTDGYKYKLLYNALNATNTANLETIINSFRPQFNRILYEITDETNENFIETKFGQQIQQLYNNSANSSQIIDLPDINIFSNGTSYDIIKYLQSYDRYENNVFGINGAVLSNEIIEDILLNALINNNVNPQLLDRIFSYVPYYDLTLNMQKKLDEQKSNILGNKIGWAINTLNWKPIKTNTNRNTNINRDTNTNQQKQRSQGNYNQRKNYGGNQQRRGGNQYFRRGNQHGRGGNQQRRGGNQQRRENN